MMPSKYGYDKRSSEETSANLPKKFRSRNESPANREINTSDTESSADVTCSLNSNSIEVAMELHGLIQEANNTKAGVVERIHMKNFMCHESLEVNFHNKVNFIVGRNGSGKSAILTALVVGLGGKASVTNRGSSLKEFIKKDKNTATISVTLRNRGLFAFQHELYGDRITVVRTLSGSTGQAGYKLKSDKGEVVSTKKEDLDRLVTALNIQVDNPISVLNQDASRTFLNNSSPHEKYTFFIRATQIEKLATLLQDTKSKKQHTSEIVKNRKETLGAADKEVNELKHRWKALQSLTELKDKAESLENELYWSMVMTEEQRLKEIESKLNEHVVQLPGLQELVDVEVEAEKEATKKIEELRGKISEIHARVTASENELMECKGEARRCQEKYSSCRRAVKLYSDKLKLLNSNVESLTQAIENFNTNSNINTEKRLQMQREVQELQERMQDVQSTLDTKKQYYSQLKVNSDRLLIDKHSLEQEKQEYDRQIERKQTEINDMKKQSHDSFSVFGSWVPKVANAIDKAFREGKLERKPIGPMGAYIKLKDASWAPAIESFLSIMMKTYCAHCPNDARVLNVIFNNVVDRGNKPSIITFPFTDKVFNVGNNCAQSKDYATIMDMLIVSEPVVLNTLIDQRDIESILLIPTSKEAYHVLSDRRNVPKNCKRGITKTGDQFYPDPAYRTYAGQGRKAEYLQVSMKEAISVAEEKMKKINIRKGDTDSQLSGIMQHIKENRTELADVTKNMESLKQEGLRIHSRLRELKDLEEPEPTSIATLTSELNEITEKCNEVKKNLSLAEAQSKELKREVEDSEAKLKAARDILRNIQDEEQPLVNQLDAMKSKWKEITSRKIYREGKYAEMCNKISQIKSAMSKQKAVVDKHTSDALQVCERIDTDRSPQEVKKELFDTQNYMVGVEQHSGSIEEIGTAYAEKKAKYTEITEGLKRLEANLRKLDKMLEDRKKKLSSIYSLTAVRIQYMFYFALLQRNYTGSLHIKHREKTLEVEVHTNKQKQASTKNLSGGERSYATVAFVMALWDAVDPPFYFLDEFDVFMDVVNRRFIMDQLLAQAKQKPNFQFVFFTPLDTSNIQTGPDVTMHRLADPRRDADPSTE